MANVHTEMNVTPLRHSSNGFRLHNGFKSCLENDIPTKNTSMIAESVNLRTEVNQKKRRCAC